nr:hypothetical protein CFP56_28990 [Quercus suber]
MVDWFWLVGDKAFSGCDHIPRGATIVKEFWGFLFCFVFFMSKIVISLYCCPTELFLVVYGRAAWKIL